MTDPLDTYMTMHYFAKVRNWVDETFVNPECCTHFQQAVLWLEKLAGDQMTETLVIAFDTVEAERE